MAIDEQTRVWVLYSNSYQPTGVFSTKVAAVEYCIEMGLGGNIAAYVLDVPLIERCRQLGLLKKHDPVNDPKKLMSFSSLFVVEVQIDMEDRTITDWSEGGVVTKIAG